MRAIFWKILFPYLEKVREATEAPDQKALLIMDNFSVEHAPHAPYIVSAFHPRPKNKKS